MRTNPKPCWVVLGIALAAAAVGARTQPSGASAEERRQAEADVPKLMQVLELRPGMTVADVGAGFGAMASVFSRQLGPTGRVYATEIGGSQLEALRRERADGNTIIVVEGADRSTNLPNECCDAIYMRDVYHHFTHPDDMNRSLFDALKPGGRLAVIDFRPERGSRAPDGVNPNRGGHGVPPSIVEQEVAAAGFTKERTIEPWPDERDRYYLALFRKP